MARPFAQVMYEARRLVAHTNRDFAKLTGVSVRTVERHNANGGVSSPYQTMKVVAALYEKNPALAKELAQVGGVNITDVTPPEAIRADPLHADAVLLAAARAVNLPPDAVRPALAAAFARAAALGANAQGLANHLARPATNG